MYFIVVFYVSVLDVTEYVVRFYVLFYCVDVSFIQIKFMELV